MLVPVLSRTFWSQHEELVSGSSRLRGAATPVPGAAIVGFTSCTDVPAGMGVIPRDELAAIKPSPSE